MCKTHVRSLGWEIPWRRKWKPTPVCLPAKCHGQRSLTDYSLWGHKRVRHDLVIKQQNFTAWVEQHCLLTSNELVGQPKYLHVNS